MCTACPVRARCLFEALERREFGIWGGTTEKQRKTLLRRYRRASCPSCGSRIVPYVDNRQVCVGCGLSWLATKARDASGVLTP